MLTSTNGINPWFGFSLKTIWLLGYLHFWNPHLDDFGLLLLFEEKHLVSWFDLVFGPDLHCRHETDSCSEIMIGLCTYRGTITVSESSLSRPFNVRANTKSPTAQNPALCGGREFNCLDGNCPQFFTLPAAEELLDPLGTFRLAIGILSAIHFQWLLNSRWALTRGVAKDF